MTFDLANDELKAVIDSLLNKQLIRKREAGNGYFISAKTSAAACDPVTGICSIEGRSVRIPYGALRNAFAFPPLNSPMRKFRRATEDEGEAFRTV